MARDSAGALRGAIVAEGEYVLDGPAHFGGGDAEIADLALLRHADGRCYIPGSSIAGAGRAALTGVLGGWTSNQEPGAVVLLFGGRRDTGDQSPLRVDDAEVSGTPRVPHVRDGVAVCPRRGTALEKHLFDMEVLPAGTRFGLRFELLLRDGQDADVLQQAFSTLLRQFRREDRPVCLGARTHRGYGRGRVSAWRVRNVDYDKPEDVAWWLLSDRRPADAEGWPERPSPEDDVRRWCRLTATLEVKSSLLIRSYPTRTGDADAVPVRADRSPGASPVVPGTTLAGVCRHRALKIARTLAPDPSKAERVVTELFGPDPAELKRQQQGSGGRTRLDSRIEFAEATITGGVEEVQNRVHIDPFTGGVRPGALFEEQPVWSGEERATTRIEMLVREPRDPEIGLVLHLLRDLWAEDLPLGGGTAIGRGVLRGVKAHFELRAAGAEECVSFTVRRDGDGGGIHTDLAPDQVERINGYATKLALELGAQEARS